MPKSSDNKVWSLPFVLISLASLAIFTGFQFLIPTLPLYITRQIGGQQSDIGLVMGAHAFASMFLCFILGPLMDRIGRKPVLLLGIGAFVLSYALLIFATILPAVVLLRLLTGVGLSATVAAMNTMIADIAPPSRRGEAFGYYGVIGTGALAFGPLAGIAVLNAYDFNTMFLVAAAVIAVALLFALPVRETMARQNRRVGHAAPARDMMQILRDVMQILRLVRLPALVMFSVTTVFGAMQAFLPVYALGEGVENPGIFFTAYAITLLLTRLFAGKLSDRFGRRVVLLPGVLLVIGAPAVLAIAGTLPAIMIAGAMMGLGFGGAQIGLMTLTVDSVDAESRGAALGYFQAAFEIGIGVGSIALGIVAQSVGFQGMFLVASLIPLAGFVAFIVGEKGHRRFVEAGLRAP